MKIWLRITISIVIISSIILIVGYFALEYFSSGTLSSASCGSSFDSGFRKAVVDNNPNFCLTFDLTSINQYRNLEGYNYCSAPQAGSFDNNNANGISRGDVEGCLKVFALQTHNSQACDLVTVSFQRDSCFFTLANRTGNQEYCNSIGDDMTKKVCLSR